MAQRTGRLTRLAVDGCNSLIEEAVTFSHRLTECSCLKMKFSCSRSRHGSRRPFVPPSAARHKVDRTFSKHGHHRI